MQYFIFIFLMCITFAPLQAQTIIEDTRMNFGTIILDPNGDIITLGTNNQIRADGNSILTGNTTPATFTITGTRFTDLNITISNADILTGPGASIPINNFTTTLNRNPRTNNRGELTFDVGASLTLSTAQLGGSYSGNFLITIEYQ